MRESKNSGKNKQHSKGYHNEYLVAVDYRNRGYKILAHRFKTPFAEIDLVCEKNDGSLILVEVKSLSESFWGALRVSARQKIKLGRALQYCQIRFGRPVELHLAFVGGCGRIDIIEDFSG